MDATSWILDAKPATRDEACHERTDQSQPDSGRSCRASRASALVVVGDLVADEFIYGRIDRVSREAPVLILKYDSTEIVPGGAGNAANNAAALGATRGSSRRGRQRRRRHAAARRRCRHPRSSTRSSRVGRYVTPVKTRILAGGIHSAKQQVVRIDRAGGASGSRGVANRRRRARQGDRGAPTP